MTNEPLKAPRHRNFGRFLHLLARHFMNYKQLIDKAANRKKGHGKAVDIDFQPDAEGTNWGAHWPTLGKNKLHDPLGFFNKNTRINSLTTKQMSRMEGPHGEPVHTLRWLLVYAWKRRVRVEAEAKAAPRASTMNRLLRLPRIKAMDNAGLLQFKTLAKIHGAPERLKPIHDAGGTTILSFTGYRGPGISKVRAWPVTDFVRGNPKWL